MMRRAVFCYESDRLAELLELEPVLLVVPECLRPQLALVDERGVPSLCLYGSEGWQRPLEQARPEQVVLVGAPGELKAELLASGYAVESWQELPESSRKAPE